MATVAISALPASQNIGYSSGGGAINSGTGTGTFTGLTSTGAAVSLNAGSNFNTAINTLNSTGTVTIGNSVAGAVTIASGHASSITVTGASLTLTTVTSGALVLNPAGAITANSAGVSSWANSAGNLTISTTISGALAVTSAGALNLTGAAASTWAMTANTAATLAITDGTNSYYTLNTQTGTSGVAAHTFAVGTATSFASATGNSFNLMSLPAYTLTQTGTTLVTALAGLAIKIGSPTVTDSSACTVTTASAVQINGPLPAGSVTFTNSFALDIPTFATNGLLSACLRIGTTTGATVNSSILFSANTGVISGQANASASIKITDTSLTPFYVLNTVQVASPLIVHAFSSGASVGFAAASGSVSRLVSVNPYTITLTGSTTVTAMDGLMLYLGAPTISNATADTVTTASALYISAPVAAGAGPITITNNFLVNTNVAGCNCTAAGVWTSTSSRNSKEDIASVDLASIPGLIDAVDVVSYRKKDVSDGGFTRYGVIAEECPDFLAMPNRQGVGSVYLSGFALAAVKYLRSENESLKMRVAELEKKLAA